jgi:hypothetical protein
MRLRPWEIVVAVIACLLGTLFMLGASPVIGGGVLCATAIWLVSRVSIADRHDSPGHYARTRGRLGLVKLVFIFAVYALVVVGFWMLRGEVSQSRSGAIAIFALTGFAFLLIRELQEAGDDALNWLIGGRAETAVGQLLDELRVDGWLVLHGYKKDRGGDIDHVVCGPGGAFAIETKSYTFRRRDVGQTAANAAWLKEHLGVRWVTGVLCVAGNHPPEKVQTVWVLDANHLHAWIKRQRGAPVEPAIARERLTSATHSAAQPDQV